MTVAAFACQPVAAPRRPEHGTGMADNDKEERLAAALRENLRKRKAQARTLGTADKAEDDKTR